LLHNDGGRAARGTSADRQRAIFAAARAAGATRDEALGAVVDWLIEETVRGILPILFTIEYS
jgi:hypothetical protein